MLIYFCTGSSTVFLYAFFFSLYILFWSPKSKQIKTFVLSNYFTLLRLQFFFFYPVDKNKHLIQNLTIASHDISFDLKMVPSSVEIRFFRPLEEIATSGGGDEGGGGVVINTSHACSDTQTHIHIHTVLPSR